MAISNPMDILLAHDAWATRQLLNACATLTPEQFHKRFEMGPGSLHDTLTHMLAAQQAWVDLLAGREERPRLEGTQRSVAELSILHEEIAEYFDKAAKAHSVEDVVSRERGGKTYAFTRGAVITHVTTHGMHHRAQCLNMLRHVGVEKLPSSSVLQWTLETGG